MTTTVRTTPAGRYLVETDGYDPLWNATMQGAIVCKVSLPASMALAEDDMGWSAIDPETGLREPLPLLLTKAERGDLIGARVFRFRRIQ